MLAYEKLNDETGRPMHKSWGNAIWFDDAVEKMGADVMRWLYAGQEPSQNMNFGYGPANEVKRRLLTLWNSYTLPRRATPNRGLPADLGRARARPADDHPLDRWLVARGSELVARRRAALDGYDRRLTCAPSSASGRRPLELVHARLARRASGAAATRQDAAFAHALVRARAGRRA